VPNFFSAFTSEVFRPLVTLLIPGAIGIATWFVGVLWRFPSLRLLVFQNHAETGLVLLLAMIFAGLVFEDAGAHFESRLDTWRDNQNGDQLKNWFAYLRTCFRADPIGRRYLRTLVLRLKFELGIACAMLSAAAGLLWLAWLGLSCRVVIVNEILCLLFATWGVMEAVSTHGALAKNRANLLKEIRIIG
jgi:hypothetical protein